LKASHGLLARSLAEAGLLLALAGGAGMLLNRDVSAPGPLSAPRTLVIEKHLGLAGIAGLLAKAGVIRHPLSFELAALLSARRRRLKAGEYAFPAAASALEAMRIIASGKVVEHPLTIPEGLTSAEVAALVRAAPELEGRVGKIPEEGDLLPETYFYTYGERRSELIERMRAAMTRALSGAWAERRRDSPLNSPQQLLILASLIEKEAKKPGEEPHIAAVFLNRLKLGMPLQSDPTVVYALSEGGKKKFDPPLTRADLGVRSPYNTYLAKGLPPGPIDNPGWAALVAAARPVKSKDLYFVASGDGGHVFAKTLPQQDRNVRSYRRIEATLAAKAALLEVGRRVKTAARKARRSHR
jgi:peptidoglycan lytic transglycosylase G